MNESQLREIEQRAAKATEGPWKVEASTEGDWVLDSRDDVIAGTFVQEGDAEFIAHAREDVPALIAALKRAYKALEAVEEYGEITNDRRFVRVAKFGRGERDTL